MSAWNECVTSALLGLEKAAPSPIPEPLASTLGGCAEIDREGSFLTSAGALSLWRRAGWKPPRSETDVPLAEPETTRPISRASASHLRTMVCGHFASVLPEWLAKVGQAQRHIPPEFLPALFDRARKEAEFRPLVIAAGGKRAAWLAAHNPDWRFAEAPSTETWETGNRDQRAAVLASLRRSAPAEAREKLLAVWKTEPADVRAAFLAIFVERLSREDAPFLEELLDDRSKEVRRNAVDLLARLPASAFTARMVARASALLAFKRGRLLSRPSLEVTLPPTPDAAAIRDGLDPSAFVFQKALGEKAVLLVLILSATPLRHWTETFEQPPAAILKAAEKNEFAEALATGWAWAALRQCDAAWAKALLDGPVQPRMEFVPGGPLIDVLPESERAVRLTAAVRAGALQGEDASARALFMRQLCAFPGEWPPELASEVLAELRRITAGDDLPWAIRENAQSLVLRLPPAMLAEAIRGLRTENEGIAQLVALLNFRHDALAALAQP